MTHSLPKETPRSGSRPTREARQQQILDATLRCVRRSGFHGASMADIAAEASLSVGVIYRYFANKEAIIEAIVANDLADMRAKFAEWDAAPDDQLLGMLLDTLEHAIEHKYCPEKAGLALEVLAEAARNPRVAAIVADADAQERELGRSLCRRISPPCDPKKLSARGEIISMIFDGMMVRAVSNPDVDRKALLKEMREVMRILFTMADLPALETATIASGQPSCGGTRLL